MERIANDPDLKHLIPQEDEKKRNRTPLFYFSLQSSSRALWIVQGRALQGFAEKSSSLRLRIFPESLRNPARTGGAGKK